jgi:nucleoside-diphosphate-sugar epimerase
MQPGDVPHSPANTQLAQQLLKWERRIDIADGIGRTLLWMYARQLAGSKLPAEV